MVNLESPTPLFSQLKDEISSLIMSNVYKYGEKLPAETELCDRYGVSRITVRKAMEELERDGLIVKKQGKGTFVEYNRFSSPIDHIQGFTYSARLGRKPEKTSRLVSKKIIPAPEIARKSLQLQRDTKVVELLRVMCYKDVPAMLDRTFVSYDDYPLLYEKIDDNVSAFKLLFDEYGLIMAEAYKEISASICEPAQSELLQCSPGEPLIDVFKTLYNADGKPVYLSLLKMPSSRSFYSVRTTRHEYGPELKHER